MYLYVRIGYVCIGYLYVHQLKVGESKVSGKLYNVTATCEHVLNTINQLFGKITENTVTVYIL